jgi:atypical dual specificity phosphatase
MPPEVANEYPRFRWLVPRTIAGAPHPDLNDGLTAVAPFLHAQGIGAIVTLYDKPLSPEPGTLGFQYLFVATPDFRPPPDLTHILSFIAEQSEQGRGVLVHCFAGIGRTGTVLAAWLLRQDPSLTTAEAIERVRDCYIPEYARLRFPEHASQEKALEQFAQRR